MEEYISREEIVKRIKKIRSSFSFAENEWEIGYNAAMADIMVWVKNIPAADVEPIQHGHWIRGKNKSAFPAKSPAIWHCSCCGKKIRYNDTLRTYQKSKKPVNEVNPRCRKCGAKMDESEGK